MSHQGLLELLAPLMRHGLKPDLAASDRKHGRIAFVPVRRDDARGIVEAWRLEPVGRTAWRLTRDARRDDGVSATIHADGTSPGELLARIVAVDPNEHFHDRDGHALAISHRLASPHEASLGVGTAPIPIGARARVGALDMALAAPIVAGVSARVDIAAPPALRARLPDDLLALLGWDWSFLEATANGWRASVRLREYGAARAHEAVRRFGHAAAHVARVLAEPPARYHARLRRERWAALLRRSLPALVWLALIVEGLVAPQLRELSEPALRLLALGAPPALLLLFFCRSQEPRFAWPRWPRPDPAPAWLAPP